MVSATETDSHGAALHQRLLAGDPTAPAEIVEAYLPALVHYTLGHMRACYPGVEDPHLAETAADDAMLSYLRRPQQYDPTKLSLDRYLRMSARGDLKNLLAAQKRRGEPGGQPSVELDATDTEHEVGDQTGPSVEEQVDVLASPVWQRLQELLPDQIDMELALLMMEGVRETSEYAAVLGIMDLAQEEQEREVKRHKDRIKKRLQRHLQRSELTDHD